MRSARYLNLIFFLFCFTRPLTAADAPLARDGVIDLSGWNFERSGPLKINGDWLFFPERIFTAEEMQQEAFLQAPAVRIAYGTEWKQASGLDRPIHTASFVLKVLNQPQESQSLSLLFDQFSQQHQTWLYRPATGELTKLMEAGALGATREAYVPQMRSLHVELPSMPGESYYLIVLASRYHSMGRFNILPVMDLTITMISRLERASWQAFFVLGMFFLLVLSNLGLFLLRPEDKPSLIIAALALLMGIRYFATEGILSQFIPEPSYLTFYCTAVPIGWSLNFGLCLYFNFFNRAFPESLPRALIQVLWILMIPLVITSLVAPAVGGPLIMVILVFQMLVALVLIVRLVRMARRRVRAAAMALAGFAFLFLSMFNDYMVGFTHAYDFIFLGHYGMIAFIVFQSLVVGSNFAHAFRTAERLTENLQHEVHQQTEKLRLQKDKLEEQKSTLEEQKVLLVKTHEELQDADEQKTRFFRSISHELRTPLTLILGSLRDQLDPKDMPTAVDMARRNAKRLFRLVNQLLDFQKLALAKFKIRLEPINLNLFVQNIAGFCVSACERKDIEFTVTMEPVIKDLKIMGQIDALEKIIFNYLANALKYTPHGGTIELNLERRALQVRIAVADSGPGIPEEQQEKLFKLFSQVEGRHQQDKQGTGLGLALVKELAQLMEGEVGVESHAGQGARFWVEFPLVLAPENVVDILLVDSHPQRAAQLARSLENQGQLWQVRRAPDIKVASEIMQEEGARVVMTLIDAGPELDRFLESCREWQPSVWRVLLAEADMTRQSSLKQLNTAQVDEFQTLPFTVDFIGELEKKLLRPTDESLPILDVVYVEDESAIRQEFTMAMERHTILQQYRVVADGASLKALLRSHRIRVVIADENLDGEHGTDLLSFVARISPDTFRIILTGETSAQVMAEGIGKAHAHHILYKPCNYSKELKLIEDYIRRSPIPDPGQETAGGGEDRDWHFAGLDNARSSMLPDVQTFERPEGTKAVILVVDDVFDMRGIIGGMLRSHGYHVLMATGGAQALQIIEAHHQLIDLVITDWLMPGMEGPSLIEALHEREEGASMPTILLTAKTDSESKAQGIRIGASAYLGKPFDEMELVSTVENLLDLKKRERKIDDLNRFINQNVLQRFLPPELVKDLLAGKAVFDDTARMRPVTVIFVDLVNFTRSTDILGPSRIAHILNDFFVRMTDVIFDHGGTIDKFLGDGMMILFGAPLDMDSAEQIRRACQCAEAMLLALVELNDSWQNEFQHSFEMRIGMHHGPAIVGSFGGQRRSDYTAIGHTVNIAFRLQTHALPGQILMTEAIKNYLEPQHWVIAGRYQLKGVEEEIVLFALQPKSLEEVA